MHWLQIFGARVAARNFEPPLAASSILAKGLENASAAAAGLGVSLPMVRAAAELYRLLKEQGKAEMDPSVLVDLFQGRM